MKMIQKPLSRHRGDDDGTEWLCVLPVIDLKCVNPQEEIDPRVCFPSCSFVSGARFTCRAGCRSALFVSRKSDDTPTLTRLISGVMADIIFPCGVGLF